MRDPIKFRGRAALAWAVALCLYALWSDPAWAQVGGQIPGGDLIISMMDAIVSFIRAYIVPVIVVLGVFAGIFGCMAGDMNRGIGRAVGVLIAGAFLASSTLWWPWVKTMFVA